MSPNDVDMISNSSSDLNFKQMDTVTKMKDLLGDNFLDAGIFFKFNLTLSV